MRNFTRKNVLVIASCAALFFSACGDDSKNAGGSVEDQEVVAISDKTVTGVSQKGPFVNGSSVTVQELNGETLAQTGLGFEGKIKNDMGEFSVKVNKLESQYALLKANGFYRNEVTGEKSKSQVTLYALTDLSKRDEVNVNLLTHLAYERSLYLAAEEDSSVAGAKKQAETEVLKSFEIEGDFGDAEDLNIFGESDQSAALLAISVLMQGNLSEGDFSERLADYAADIESDGVWNDAKTATQIADWAITQSMSGGLAVIRNNIANWKLSADVPSFEKYVDNFWWQNYGLGTCEKKREGEVMKNQNAGSAFADRYFICKSNLWYVTTDMEKDTYEWKEGKDGDAKYGDVIKSNCYVFEDSSWRSGYESDCSLELRGCTKNRQDTVGLGKDNVWYICDAKSWREAINIEKDTATWGAGKKDGEVRAGQVNKDVYYIYDAGEKTWRNATTIEKDTYDWKDSTDGAIKKGNVTDTIYVFDATAWRVANGIEKVLGGCVKSVNDSISKVGDIYYICNDRKWTKATALQYDTYKRECTQDGKMFGGFVNTTTQYVCDDGKFRSADSLEIVSGLTCTSYNRDTLNILPKIYLYKQKEIGDHEYIMVGHIEQNYSYYRCAENGWEFTTERINKGTMVDERDGHIYKIVGIRSQMWMAENLNYADSINYPSMLGRNWCYDDVDTCAKYGRLYTWSAAIDSVYWTGFGEICGYDDDPCAESRNISEGMCPDGLHDLCNLPEKVQGICPSGWHVPSIKEWETLRFATIGATPYALQAKGFEEWKKATDEYGFSSIPAGYYFDGGINGIGSYAIFWGASESNSNRAGDFYLNASDVLVQYRDFLNYALSVRCIKDEDE